VSNDEAAEAEASRTSLQFRYICLTISTASSSFSASASTMRLSTSVTSILYFVIQNAKVPKISDDLANRSKLNKKDQNRSNNLYTRIETTKNEMPKGISSIVVFIQL
jgi:hypothetical protein